MTVKQPSLFNDQEAQIPPEFQGNIVLQAKSAAQTPLEREFARLLQNIEQSKLENARLEQLYATYSYKFEAKLKPLKDQEIAAEHSMVLFLHARLQQAAKPKDLTAKQRQAIARVIVNISHQLALEGDAQMQAIHDQYSLTSMEDEEQEDVQELLSMMEELGLDTRGLPEDASRDEVLAALQKAALAQHEAGIAAEEKRQGKRAARKQAKAAVDPKAQAKLAQEEATKKMAEANLRDIYRQLARQLHPDRATDDAQRASHHDLMSQVNAAYDKQDLLTLLKLQLQAQQLDSAALGQMAEEKLRGFNAMLKKQWSQIVDEITTIEMRIHHELGLPPLRVLNDNILDAVLEDRMQGAQEILDQMQEDLETVKTDAGLKRWAKSQDRMM